MVIRWAYLKRVLAGAIFGLYMAHLLYFLNPQVDVTPARLAVVTVVYGLTCGIIFGSLLWGLRVARVMLLGRVSTDGYRTHGFGFVVFAAFLASAIYWMHLTTLRIYLPVGAVRILSKATNVITATAFILLALWFFERTADRRRSRIIFVVGVSLIALSAFFLYQRRDSYRTDHRVAVVANVGTVAGQRPVLVVAIRNLPYDWLVTMSGEGSLPFFQRAMNSAYFARIEPFPSPSSKSLWASLVTGKLPYRHGVTGRYAYRTPFNGPDPAERFSLLPTGVGFSAWGLLPASERISAQLPSGDALPLWKIFERLSLHSEVIGWPAVAPGDAAFVTTDRELATRAADPAAIAAATRRIDGTGRYRDAIVRSLALDDAAVAAASRHRDADPALTIVALEGFAAAQRAIHVYANTLEPRETAKGTAMRQYVQQLDRMLDALAREHPDHLLIVCSPSGVTPPPLAVSAYSLAMQTLRRDDPGADDGVLAILGAGTAHPPRPEGTYVVDLVPTLLFASGLPVGRDMDGRVLTEAFDDDFVRSRVLAAIPTWEARQLLVRRVQ